MVTVIFATESSCQSTHSFFRLKTITFTVWNLKILNMIIIKNEILQIYIHFFKTYYSNIKLRLNWMRTIVNYLFQNAWKHSVSHNECANEQLWMCFIRFFKHLKITTKLITNKMTYGTHYK